MHRTKPFFYLLSLFLILGVCPASGNNSNIGVPDVFNFFNKNYQAGTQNWDIAQHPNGFMFFANNNGLLQFDGTSWANFPIKNKTVVRSVLITKDRKIYTGGQGEFGYFEPDTKGGLQYHSLVHLIPDKKHFFSDVWNIVELNERIYFSTTEQIFIFDQTSIRIIPVEELTFLAKAGNTIFMNQKGGLFRLQENQPIPVESNKELKNKTITDIAELAPDSLLISTLTNGFFLLTQKGVTPFYENLIDFWSANRIYCWTKLNSHEIAVGTNNAGLVILNKNGQVKQNLRKRNGLQNNNILSLYQDNADNLWLGLDNGIDMVALNTKFTKIIPDGELEGTAYAAAIHKDKLYLGTSSGLYVRDWKNYYNPLQPTTFELVKGSEGQVWQLKIIDNQLFLGHHRGGFLVSDQQATPINNTPGNWTIQRLVQNPDYFLIGTYEGLVLMQKKNNQWQVVKKYNELKESCRFLEQDEDGNIWIAHPYRGIYKVNLSPDLEQATVSLYGKEKGLPSDNQNHVFKINGQVIITGETGVFHFDKNTNQFVPHEKLNNLLGKNQSVLRFFEDKAGNIWYVTAKETGILKINNKGLQKSFTKNNYPELNQKLVRGFEFIYPFDKSNIFIGAEKGFILFNPNSKNNSPAPFRTNITNVVLMQQDSTLLEGQYTDELPQNTTLSHYENAIRFSYTSPVYYPSDIRYATQLVGHHKDWSNWTAKTEKEFTNLSPGNYQFLVKAITPDGQESPPTAFAFQVQSPWYASHVAIALYTLTAIALLAGIIFIPRKRYQKEKIHIETKFQEATAKNEREIIELKNQQLQAEIAHKNQELAMSTMHLVQRGELINQLKDRLNKVIKDSKDVQTRKELRRINRLLDSSTQLDEAWNQFAYHFDEVHNDFLKRIKTAYPNLTANDQKLCAYLRMNLSTKEMVPLMNISIRGIEVARYRLRKKLELDSSVNLNEFMMDF